MTEKKGKYLGRNYRPWGYYQVLCDESNHKVKRIVVYSGKRISLQRHLHRAEHWYIIYGEAMILLDNKELYLRSGESIDIHQGMLHRIMNPGIDNMVFIEIQTGDYFGEDDIERIEDDYGRI